MLGRCRRNVTLDRVMRCVDQHDWIDRNDRRKIGDKHQCSRDLHELPTLCKVILAFGLCWMVWKITQ